jgi:hypothetical protein
MATKKEKQKLQLIALVVGLVMMAMILYISNAM